MASAPLETLPNKSRMEQNNSTNSGGRWVTKKEIAEHLKCCPRTINNLMSRRILPYRRVGKLLRFELGECDRAIDAFKVSSFSEKIH